MIAERDALASRGPELEASQRRAQQLAEQLAHCERSNSEYQARLHAGLSLRVREKNLRFGPIIL